MSFHTRVKFLGILAAALLVVGCAGTEPYIQVGLGVPLDGHTDYWLQTDREWQCSKGPQAHIEMGLETPNNFKIGLNHQSWWLCGSVNDRPEVYSNQIVLSKTWGGASD